MGKKKDKFSDVDFLDGSNEDLNKALERFGVKGASSGRSDRGGNPRSVDTVKAELKEAARNDYDYRRSLEAAAMSGDKKAANLSTKGKIGGILRGQDHLAKLKKEHVGGGGMGGSKNIMGLTQALVQHDRETQEENLVSKDFLDERLNALKDKFKTEVPEPEGPVEYDESPEVVAARGRLDSDYYETSESIYGGATEEPTTAFRQANDNAPVRDDTSTAVGSYLDQYKKDLIKGGRIGEARTDNLNNAYNTVMGNDI